MKKKNVLLRVIVILLIMIVSLISFFGIYKRNLNSWENILPNYNFGKDLGESSTFGLRVSTETKTVEDKDAAENNTNGADTEENKNETTNNTTNTNTTTDNTTVDNTTEETENKTETPKKQVPVNDASILNKENYKKSKEIIEKRLKDFEVIDSIVSLNDENGEMTISLSRDEKEDYVPTLVSIQGKIEVVDSETQEVLIDRNMITKVSSYYVPVNQTDNGQTYEIGLQLQFNSEGKKKLSEISKKYIETTDSEGKTTQKRISIQLDGTNIHTTYFSQDFSLNYLPVTLYSSVSVKDGDLEEFNRYRREAFMYQVAINAGELPIVYTSVQGTYFANSLGEDYVKYLVIGIVIVLAIVSFVMIAKFKGNGLKSIIIELGYIAIVLLLIRAANVPITLAGTMMILFMSLLNYLLLSMFMNKEKVSEFGRFTLNLIPFIITILVFNFATDINLESVGMIGVWGLITFAYTLVTSIILLDNRNTKKNGVEKNEE